MLLHAISQPQVTCMVADIRQRHVDGKMKLQLLCLSIAAREHKNACSYALLIAAILVR